LTDGRKVAAILLADIVGFSRMAGGDEERTLARLRALRSDLIDPTVAIHNGRVVKGTGDGVIADFRSVVEAVRCAIEIQSGMAERNVGVSADKRIVFRIGIHLGDVVEEADGDLMGDGVNVAARLEGICEPGGICLSEDAYRQVRDKLHETFVDLGEPSLKNIPRPVRVYLLRGTAGAGGAVNPPAAPASKSPRGALRWAALAAALVAVLIAAGWYGRQAFFPPSAPAPAPASAPVAADDRLAHAPRLSIIVLPFANVSGDSEQDYFADGLTDDLTTDLSHLPDSFVIAHDTALTYKGRPVDAKQLGRDLGVRYALEGSVRRVGETITVNAQLISTETGAHIWADRLEGERSRLGELQVEFVSRLANSLNVQLIQAESLRAMRERPTKPDEADLTMRGWATMSQGFSLANMNKAIGYFDEALRLDPENPHALTAKAAAKIVNLRVFGIGDWTEVLHDAEQAADRVLASHPNDAWAHFVKAQVSEMRGQFDAARAELNGAIAGDRNFAPAYAELGYVMILLGRAPEAFKPIELALRLSPRFAGRNIWEYYMCHAHALLAEWEQAIEWCGTSIASNPTFPPPHIDLAAAYGWLGRSAEANDEAAKLQKLAPGLTAEQFLGSQPIDNPKWKSGTEQIAEGLRKAGLTAHQPSYPTDQGSKWCSGVKIAAIVGWPPGGDPWSDTFYNGVRQAEVDLGASLTYLYAHWSPDTMLADLQVAIDSKADGVVVIDRLEDAAEDALIDKAFQQGTIVTTALAGLPEAEKEHAAQGMGSVGPPASSAFALASEAAKRAGLKTGDGVLVWARTARPGGIGSMAAGMVEALEKAGARVVFLETDPAYDAGGGDPAGAFATAIKANPDVKLVVTDNAGLTASLGYFALSAGLKPGQVFMAGVALTPKAVQAIKEGYVGLIYDLQPYLTGYLPILNICLTTKFGFSGLDFNTGGAFVDAHNVDAVAPLVEKSIR
jgi:class 3 adenylate cyclase/TolB-like protein/ABC-type sugar transport system substrate-binding protein